MKPLPESLPPAAAILQLLSGCFVAQAVYVAARLGVPDRLAGGPKAVEALAGEVGAHPGALQRVLRLLVSQGVFAQPSPGVVANTPISETLRSGGPDSLRDMAIWWVEEPHWRVYGKLLESVRTGDCAWPMEHGRDIFPYLSEVNPGLGEVFNRAMTSFSSTTSASILDAYDFSPFEKVADIGGGHGRLLAEVLTAHPRLRGVLCDLEAVVAGAYPLLRSHGVLDRVDVVPCDFFKDASVRADAYLLKHILHDWPDRACIDILLGIRRAMSDHAKVLILDMVVPDGDEPHFSKVCDLEMLVSAGGIERSAEEFRRLLSQADLRLNRVIPTRSFISVIEATAA